MKNNVIIATDIDKNATEFAYQEVRKQIKDECLEYIKKHHASHFDNGNKVNMKQCAILMMAYFMENADQCNLPTVR